MDMCTANNTVAIVMTGPIAKEISDEFGVSSDDDYPLVIDAPFSNTDEEHIKKICDVLPTSCDQLIMCMINKDYKVAKDDLNDKIGRKYKIVKLSETEDRIEEVD